MGNCCDRFEDRNIYDDGDTERRPLLGVDGTARGGDGAGSTSPGGVKPDFGGGGGGTGGASLGEKGDRKNDEQSALNRILQTTADQVIDVGALDSRGLEQRDYLDRARQYSSRFALSVKPPPFLTQPANLLAQQLALGSSSGGGASPTACLSAPTAATEDLKLVVGLASRCADAVRDVVVAHQEDLVVPFGV